MRAFTSMLQRGWNNAVMDSKSGFEGSVRGLIGLSIEAVDYWDVHNFGDEPARWDYGDWHHAVMGVQLTTDAGPISVMWTNRFYPYGVEVFRDQIESFLVLGEEGPQRVGPDGPSQWDRFFGLPIIGAATNWEVLGLGPGMRDGQIVTPARSIDLPTAVRLDFDAGSVWFVTAMPQWPDMEQVFMPGDEVMVVFSEEKARAMGLEPWF